MLEFVLKKKDRLKASSFSERHIDFIIADMLQKNLNIDENIKLMFLLNLPIMWF